MANPQGNIGNLQPVQTKEEAKKRGQNGGKKSGQVRRERKKAKECMEMILSLGVKGKKQKELMESMGIKEKDQKNIMLLMTTLFVKAASTGDPNAIKTVLAIAGEMEAERPVDEKPTININVTAATADDIEVE